MRNRRGLATAILMVAAFMDLIDATIVNVALPTIRTDLDSSSAGLEWVVSAYLLAFAVLLVTGGRLGDIYGRRRVFVAGVAGFTLFSLAAALAPTIGVLIAARVGQGAFAAMMAPQLLASVQVLYQPHERAPIFGLVGGVSGLAAVVGPLLGGALVTADLAGTGWRAVFAINIPVGITIIALAVRYVPDSTAQRPLRLDWPGVGLATTGLFLLAYPLVEGRSADWPGWIWGLLVAAALVLATFVAYQARREHRDGSSLLPMRLFANRGFSAGIVVQSVFQFCLAGFSLATTIYLQTGLGFTAIASALTFVPFSVGAIVGTAVAVPLGVRLGKVVVLVGALIEAAASGWVILVVDHAGTLLRGWNLAPPFALAGIGLGLLVVPLVDISLSTVDPDDAGAASGAYGTLQQVGAALGIAVVGVVFFGVVDGVYTSARLGQAIVHGTWVAVVGYLVCAAATLLLPSRAAVRARAAERARVEHATGR